MNDFLYKWQPKVIEGGDLILADRGYGDTVTDIHCSEGDTLFIRQTSGNNIERVALTREELYDIMFNFMSVAELIELATKRSQYDIRQNFKPYTVKK
jgi:hypothetical protein